MQIIWTKELQDAAAAIAKAQDQYCTATRSRAYEMLAQRVGSVLQPHHRDAVNMLRQRITSMEGADHPLAIAFQQAWTDAWQDAERRASEISFSGKDSQ